MYFRNNQELTALIQARKAGLQPAMNGAIAEGSHPSEQRHRHHLAPAAEPMIVAACLGQNLGHTIMPSPPLSTTDHPQSTHQPMHNQPAITVVLENLAPNVSDFDLASLVPPHLYPTSLRNNAPAGGWAHLGFQRLDDGIAVWNHTRHLLVGGHLDHLRDSDRGRAAGLMVKLAPEAEYLRFMFEATKSFMTNPPKLPVPHALYISNLDLSVCESDIHSLFPQDIADAIRTINVLSPGRSLSPPFPDADSLLPLPRVGRATVYFVKPDAASEAFQFLQDMQEAKRRALSSIMYSPTFRPIVLCPAITRIVLEARAKMGDEHVQRLIRSAIASPVVAPPVRAELLAPLPTPSPTIASSRSSTASSSSSSPPPSCTSDRSSNGSDTNSTRLPFARTMLTSSSTDTPIRPPSDPYEQIHLVIVRNLCPTLPASQIHALATPTAGASFSSAPTHIDISPTTKSTVLAYHTIQVRPVKYVFRTRDDVTRFL
ncbi:hypothetical protein BCR44DRAFT_352763, partial [Catenaria anguillulae PL171]